MLNFQQAARMNNNDYYEKTANCVKITLNAGGVLYTHTTGFGGPREVHERLQRSDVRLREVLCTSHYSG
jgi:hypothetical protein